MASVGVGVIGFGWMGQAHSRAYLEIPVRFEDVPLRPRLVACADTAEERRTAAASDFGFGATHADWRRVVEDPAVDVVVITTPNEWHLEIATAAAAAGKHIFCEKPVGRTPEETAAIESAARRAGVVSGVGFNYRWAPLVQHLRGLVGDGVLGELTHFRGRFFSMYGRDPRAWRTWRFLEEKAGHGALRDLMTHAIDLAVHLAGPVDRLVATRETFIDERPVPSPGSGGQHYGRSNGEEALGAVTNEDYVGALVVFANGARGTLESDRTMMGPESELAFELHGRTGAARWSLERMNELGLFVPDRSEHDGYVTLLAGDVYPHHGRFVPGRGIPIGYEDLKVIEVHEFLRSIARGEQHSPGLADALMVANVEAAMITSWESGTWEPVVSLPQGDG